MLAGKAGVSRPNMKFTLILLLLIYSQISFGESSIKFSSYESDLRIDEIDNKNLVVTFSGEVELSGTLVFRLDMITDSEFGEPLFIDFIPDNDQLALLPQVTEGFYAKVLDRMSVFGAEELYHQLYGEGFTSKERELRKVGILRVKSYATSVECDSRQYFARLISFEPSKLVANINTAPINGC